MSDDPRRGDKPPGAHRGRAAEGGGVVDHRRLAVSGRKGPNTIVLAYADWNHGKTVFAETDLRPMALFIRKLRLLPAD